MPSDLNESGNDSANEKILIDDENEDANELDDEFDDIQVDSPVQERNSPSPVGPPPPPPASKKFDDSEPVKDERPCEDFDETPRKKPRLEQPKDEGELSGVTHCHHNGGQTHYTMRPPQGIIGMASDGKLHVRRDLHYKVDATSSIHSPNPSAASTSSIMCAPVPFRKISAGHIYDGSDNDHPIVSSSHLVPIHSTHSTPLNLSNHTSTNRSQENANGKPRKAFEVI